MTQMYADKTALATPLIVTARTYGDAPGGTLGQFVPAVTRIKE